MLHAWAPRVQSLAAQRIKKQVYLPLQSRQTKLGSYLKKTIYSALFFQQSEMFCNHPFMLPVCTMNHLLYFMFCINYTVARRNLAPTGQNVRFSPQKMPAIFDFNDF